MELHWQVLLICERDRPVAREMEMLKRTSVRVWICGAWRKDDQIKQFGIIEMIVFWARSLRAVFKDMKKLGKH